MSGRGFRDGCRRAGAGCLAALLLACGSGSPLPPAPRVEYGGCWSVSMPGPVCALYPSREEPSESRLRLWVKAEPGAEVEIRCGNRVVPATGQEVQGGLLIPIEIPVKCRLLTVRLRGPDGTRSRPWSLRVTPAEIPPWWTEAVRLQSAGESRQAQRRLAGKTVPQSERGLLLWALAILARQEGNDEESAAYLRQGIASDQGLGVLSGEWTKRGLLAWIEINHGQLAEARSILPSRPLPAGAPAEAQILKAFYQGLLADRVGDYRSALEELQSAADLAERNGSGTYRWKAEQLLAHTYQSLGRSRKAADLFKRLRAEPQLAESPCDRGDLLVNLAWSWLLAREGGEAPGDPIPVLQEAQAIYDREACRAEQRLNARLNLALAHQQAGRWRDARRTLEEIRPLASAALLSQRLWWLDLEGRQAIAEGRPARALELYRELAGVARRADSLEGSFRAALGRAHARIALGERTAAVGDLAVADGLLDEQTWLIPASEGRDTFLAQREEATRLDLELLLAAGRKRSAFALARRARSRLLRQLGVQDRLTQLTSEERQRWEKALSAYWTVREAIDREAADEWQIPPARVEHAREDRSAQLAKARKDLDAAIASFGAPLRRAEDSLSPPRRGEIILAYHALPRGWAGFAAHRGGLEVATFTLPPAALADPAALGRLLLAPFRSAINRSERVRVLPSGPLQRVDFHSLPLAGEPLLARHAVVYSLDLASRPSAEAPARPAALLVADPQGNLAAARQEAATVSAAIRAWGWPLTRLDGPAAGAGPVRRALATADLFHFAGHGNFAGFAGWDSALRLADGSRLTLSDLLALRRVPAWVVLSACDSGRSSEQAPGEGIGLAQAFLLAGAREVIAAVRPVDDATARDLIGELYREWQPGADLARQLQRAQLACGRRHPGGDFASFRLLER
jgi:tetratricopeptide (TPR) repeat protein